MFVITGASGQTGTATMLRLLELGQPVSRRAAGRAGRVVARARRGRGYRRHRRRNRDDRGVRRRCRCLHHEPAGLHGRDILAQARAVHGSLIRDAEQAGVGHVVGLSSVGAQHAEGTGNILTTHDLEVQLAQSRVSSTRLRAANFIDYWAWAIGETRTSGELPSMLLPTDRRIPLVAAADIGRIAADLLIEGAEAPDRVELRGPTDYSPDDAAAVLSELFHRPVLAKPVAEDEWPNVFRGSGLSESAVDAFCDMYCGFNNGLVSFEYSGITKRGIIDLRDTLAALI